MWHRGIAMRHIIRINLSLVFSLLFMLPIPAAAIPAITCHCFTDRSFETARPAAADPYFLATTQNSFFAIVYNVDKKTIVIKKQQGTSPDDLWIAYRVASISGVPADTLLQARQKHESWKDVIAAAGIAAKKSGSRFSNELSVNSSSAHLAETVVDEIFLHHRLMGEGELAEMRRIGASNQELIISAVISAKTGRSAKQVYLDVKNGSKTWGGMLTSGNIDTKNMQREISKILKIVNGER